MVGSSGSNEDDVFRRVVEASGEYGHYESKAVDNRAAPWPRAT